MTSDIDLLYFAILGGFFFSFLVFFERTDESSWKDIVKWGTGVYVTFSLLGPLNTLVHSDSPFNVDDLVFFTVRWFVYIFSIVLFTGILTWYRRSRIKQ